MSEAGKLIWNMIEAAEQVSMDWSKDNDVRPFSKTVEQSHVRGKLAASIGMMDSRIKFLKREMVEQCWHETVESRRGACDGGERCKEKATTTVNDMALCDKHGQEELDAQKATQDAISKSSEQVRAAMDYLRTEKYL